MMVDDGAKWAGTLDENTHEIDNRRYLMFCKGSVSLDCTLLQLAEPLKVLKDL